MPISNKSDLLTVVLQTIEAIKDAKKSGLEQLLTRNAEKWTYASDCLEELRDAKGIRGNFAGVDVEHVANPNGEYWANQILLNSKIPGAAAHVRRTLKDADKVAYGQVVAMLD